MASFLLTLYDTSQKDTISVGDAGQDSLSRLLCSHAPASGVSCSYIERTACLTTPPYRVAPCCAVQQSRRLACVLRLCQSVRRAKLSLGSSTSDHETIFGITTRTRRAP